MLTFPAILIFASVAPVGVLRAKLFGTPPMDRLAAPPALFGEEGEAIPNCVFLFCHLRSSRTACVQLDIPDSHYSPGPPEMEFRRQGPRGNNHTAFLRFPAAWVYTMDTMDTMGRERRMPSHSSACPQALGSGFLQCQQNPSREWERPEE